MINDKKIKKHSDLVKRQNAVINTDSAAYLQAKERREKELALLKTIELTNELETRVNELDNKLDLIIKLLKDKQ